jgi:hypothetical protein
MNVMAWICNAGPHHQRCMVKSLNPPTACIKPWSVELQRCPGVQQHLCTCCWNAVQCSSCLMHVRTPEEVPLNKLALVGGRYVLFTAQLAQHAGCGTHKSTNQQLQ